MSAPKAGAHSLILRVLPRTKQKVHVSPKRLVHGLRFCECKVNKYQTIYQINQSKMFFHAETIA
jgi:hypothetical protein